MIKLLIFLVVVCVAGIRAENLYIPGPFDVDTSTIVIDQDDTVDITTNETKPKLEVWQPISNGTFPLLFYMGGFSSRVRFYDTILTRISSHGFIVIGIDGPSGSNSYEEEADLLEATMGWMILNLNDYLILSGISADIENQAIFGAHSAGNHAMVQLLENTCLNAKGLIMMSPVDGADPFGIVDDFVITPGVKTMFSLPTLHIAAGLDPEKLNVLFPPCAPEDLANDRFYDNMNGQIFSINALEWGHSDLITPCTATICPAHPRDGFICSGADDYQSFLSATSIAFMKGILRSSDDECSNFDYLTNETTMPIDVTTKNTAVEACPLGGCKRVVKEDQSDDDKVKKKKQDTPKTGKRGPRGLRSEEQKNPKVPRNQRNIFD